MFRYFMLRLPHQALCWAYSFPLAVFFTLGFSPFATWDNVLFFQLLMTLTALFWGGLALYLRQLDRLRGLADSTDTYLRQGKHVVGKIKRHTKAQLEWDILHDNAIIGRQLRGWRQGVVRYTARAILYSPAFVLLSAGITFAFMPDIGATLVSQLRTYPAECIVRWAEGIWVSATVITCSVWVLADTWADTLPPNCFHDELLLRAKNLSSCSSESDAHSSQPSLGEEK